jgi:hypothetical protein
MKPPAEASRPTTESPRVFCHNPRIRCQQSSETADYDQLVVIRVMTTVAISQARRGRRRRWPGTPATTAFHNQRLAKKASKGASALKRRAD